MNSRQRRHRGEGSIFRRTRKLPSGREIVEWVHIASLGFEEGSLKRIRRYFYGRTKAEVQEKVAIARGQNGGTIARSTPLTVAQYLESWLSDVKKSRASTTARSYGQRIRSFVIPNIGNDRLDQVDAERMKWLYDVLVERGVSADNVQKTHKALRRAFNIAVGQGRILRNPVAFVARPQHRVRKRDGHTAKQIARLLAAAEGDRLAAMLRLACMAAMRPGELFALRWDDVNLDHEAHVDVRNSLRDDRGALSIAEAKSDSARRIPLDSETAEALKQHRAAMMAEKHGANYVFVTPRGKWLRIGPTNKAVLAPILERAGLPPATLYDLRHASISLFGEAGVHLRVAADIAGHSTTNLTANTYTHAGVAMHRDGIERIAALVRAALPAQGAS